MSKKLILIAAAGLLALVGCASSSVSEEELGLRKTDLYTEESTVADKTEYGKDEAGKSSKIKRAFRNAPPMIPHSVEGLIPIKADNNSCLGCHEKAVAPSLKATPMPDTHYYDMRNGKKLDAVSSSRFNCTQCHAPQSDNNGVKNNFEPDFSSPNTETKSDLAKEWLSGKYSK